MKLIFKRLIHFPSWSHPAVINPAEPPSDEQSPLQRVMAIASVACFAALTFVYWAARPAVARLGVWWAEVLVYAIIPVAVTFVILYRSCWHQEIAGGRRTCSVLLASCAIFAGVLLATGVMVSLAWFGSIAIRTGVGGR
jgi:hypothetical protein